MGRVKYPRTLHLPFSPGKTDDDKVMKHDPFIGKDVVVSRKMDGENFTGYPDGCHARSIDGKYHWTRTWARNYWMERAYKLNKNQRVCAENLYATHSIEYNDLESYLLVFSAWEENLCLSWDKTLDLVERLELNTVPVIYQGIWDKDHVMSMHDDSHEGFVVRVSDEFHIKDFGQCVGKYVRKNHVQTETHWMHSNIKLNKMKGK